MRDDEKWVWSYDEKSDSFQCGIASEKLRREADALCDIYQFAMLGVCVRREMGPIVEKGLVKTITVHELGFPIKYTSLKYGFSKYDPYNFTQRDLVYQLRKSNDSLCAMCLKSSPLKADNYVSAMSMFMDIPSIEPFVNDCFIGICGKKLSEQVSASEDFMPWKQYLREGDTLRTHELGMLKRVKWVATDALDGFGPAEGAIFGKGGLSIMESERVHLRADASTVGWYGVVGFGIEKGTVVYIEG